MNVSGCVEMVDLMRREFGTRQVDLQCGTWQFVHFFYEEEVDDL